jgi:hypothetical protein
MQFFLLDFALALVALLGYRAVAAVAQDRVPTVSLEGSPHPSRGGSPGVTRPRRRVGQEPVLTESTRCPMTHRAANASATR